MGIQPENEKDVTGETSLSRNWSVPLFFRSTFILLVILLVIEINVRNRVMQGQLLQPLSAYLCSYKDLIFVHNIFWSGDQLTFYGPTFLSIDKG